MKSRSRSYLRTLLFLTSLFMTCIAYSQVYVKSDFQVSDFTGYIYTDAELSVSNTGEMVVVWETAGLGDIHFRIVSSLGEQLGPQIALPTTFSTDDTRVGHNDSGNFMIMFNAYGAYWYVLGQSYTSEGVPLTDTMVVSRNTTEMINLYHSSLRSNKEGQFGAFLPGLDSAMVEMFTGNGEYLSGPVVFKPDAVITHEIHGLMTYSGEHIMVWLDGASGDIEGQRYSADGTPVGEVFQVNEMIEGSYVSNALLCADTAGNFAVIWTNSLNSELDIYSQKFSKEGSPIGGNVRVTDDNALFLGQGVSMDMDIDGNFVVAWSDTRSSDTSFIYMQQFDELAQPVGGNFRATSINNQDSQGMASLPEQTAPSVRILRDTIYLAWVNFNENLHYQNIIFANIQEWSTPDVTGLRQSLGSTERLSIYPNPSSGDLTIQFSRPMQGDCELSLFNSAGTLILRSTLHLNSQIVKIELPELQEGLYYLEINGNDHRSATPVLIKK